jgi:folate-binding protein YgfZ
MKAWTECLSTQTPAPLRDSNALCALDSHGLLYVGGDDAEEFLQNQLSNDIRQIDQGRSQLSAFSNAKGRMIVLFRVIAIEGGYLLLMPKQMLPLVQEKLQRFVLMSRVILADISNDFACISLTVDEDATPPEPNWPTGVNRVWQSDTLISIRLPAATGRQRWLLLSTDAAEAIALWRRLSDEYSINSAAHWRLQNIDAGIPTLYPATSEAFVLQMANLQLIDGVSFRKGCYPGQEVVARMQYLGKLKRRMYRARIDSAQAPEPGAGLAAKEADGADGSGKVVDAVSTAEGDSRLLFIARIDLAESGNLKLVEQPDVRLELLPLPYPFEKKE